MPSKYPSLRAPSGAPRKRFSPDRATLGVVIDWAIGDYQETLVLAICDAARKRNVNVVFFSGDALGATGVPRERNDVYRLIGPENVDALIIASAGLGNFAGVGAVAELCQRFGTIPRVSITAELPGTPSILVDNDAGMRELVEHLVVVHGFRRIAFVRGAPSNVETEGRYRAYREVLEAHGLDLHEHLVVTGGDGVKSGIEAVTTLLDERRVRIDTLDAIVACDDVTASGVLDELTRRDIHVPDDVAVTGFDDNEEIRYVNPPLTTVRQPLLELGARAVQLAMDRLNSAPVADREVLPTRLVIRRSCRCVSRLSQSPPVRLPLQAQRLDFEAAMIERRELVLADLSRAARGGLGAAGAGWESRMFNAFVADMRGDAGDQFIASLDVIIGRTLSRGGQVRILHDVLGVLRRHLLPFMTGAWAKHERAEELFHDATKMVSDTLERSQALRRIEVENRIQGFTGLISAFSRWKSMLEFSEQMLRTLPELRIGLCVAATYDDEDPSWVHLQFAYDARRRIAVANLPERYAARKLIPDLLAPDDVGLSLLTVPLCFEQRCLGFMVMDVTDAVPSVLYALPALVSLAVYGDRLRDTL